MKRAKRAKTGEIRVTDPKTGGQKGRKPERYELIPPDVLVDFVVPSGSWIGSVFVESAVLDLANFERTRKPLALHSALLNLREALSRCDEHPGDELARVYAFGAEKYADWNWLKGYAWSLSFGACCRHISHWDRGVKCDEESGRHHLAHALWHVVTLISFAEGGLGKDDLFPVASVEN